MTPGDFHRILNVLSDMYLTMPTQESLAEWQAALAAETLTQVKLLKQSVHDAKLANGPEREELQTEFDRLFIEPDAMPCPPWESLYASPDEQIMEEAQESLIDLYDDAGLDISASGIPPDHIGAELHFLALLLERVENGSEEEQEAALELADELFEEHLNIWVANFTRDLEQAASAPLYKALAQSTREVLSLLQET